jgi:hypothetical protein
VQILLHKVNIKDKTIDGVVHPEQGMRELITALLSQLDPKVML